MSVPGGTHTPWKQTLQRQIPQGRCPLEADPPPGGRPPPKVDPLCEQNDSQMPLKTLLSLAVGNYYCPQTKLWKDNVFTPVFDSVHGGGCVSQPAMGRGVYRNMHWANTPSGRHPPGRHPRADNLPPGSHPLGRGRHFH